MKMLMLVLTLAISLPVAATPRKSAVDFSYNDEIFLFKNTAGRVKVFKAQTYCFNIEEGDQVIWLEGGPDQVCLTAEFLHPLSKQTCRVWCP